MDGYPVCAACWNMHHDQDVHPAKDPHAEAGAKRHCSHCGSPTISGLYMMYGRYCDVCHITEPQAGPYHQQGD